KAIYSLLSLVGLALIVYGFAQYRQSGWIQIWSPPSWTRHITIGLMWPASICVVAAYLPGRIKTTLKHPMLTGVKLWAFAHLLSNGDLGGILLFVGILAWAVFDRISLKRRTDPGGPNIPVGGIKNDVAAVLVGTLVYLSLGFVFHPAVMGIPVFGR
ncbi:MAG TPA: NnrU family protein, partial [Xanthobacteraceae bacterium]|nr:NnrU family protein [Xanthobacteraceae bacterium]